MPLQESFGKKSKPEPATTSPAVSKPRVLTAVPNLEDLRFTLLEAQSAVRQPIVIMYRKENGHGCLLTATRNSEDNYDPTWMLQVDEGNNRANIQWTYTTSDAELIYNLLTEEVTHTGPAAVIPESLRPRQPDEAQQPADTYYGEEEPVYFEHYQILNTIGRGGMGIIYRARHRLHGTLVALKVLRADLLVDPVSVRRFEQEATVASQLLHPNLISVREFGLSRFGQPYLIMDYLDGVELQTLLSHCEHLDLPSFINVFTQICDGMAYAHDKGLIHRDLKPGNIMLVKTPGGSDAVKIIDFGIAKMLRENHKTSTITTAGDMLGSPAYMSPEQCGGVQLDSRSDIYSLGCVMYEAITGLLPFRSDSPIGTIMMQVNESAQTFAHVRPDLQIPAELERIIFKALEKDPSKRYQTAGELSEDLWAFAALGYQSRPGTETPHTVPEEEEAPTNRSGFEKNTMSNRAFTLLRQSGVLDDALLKVIADCEGLMDGGKLSLEQAVQVLQATRQGVPFEEAVNTSTERTLTLFEALALLDEQYEGLQEQ